MWPSSCLPPSSGGNHDAVDQVLRQAVSQHVQAVIQDVVVGKDNTKPSLQIDRKVPLKLMHDIWENKYVDFLELLDEKENLMPLQLVINESGEQQWYHSI